MQQLGGRVVPPETLESRIAARLNEALDTMVGADLLTVAERGLGAVEDQLDPYAWIRLSVEDVARIAAQEARAWF